VTATLANLTMTNGRSDFGGGINTNGNLTVINSTISGNTAPINFGGGIYSNGNLTLVGSTITGNTAGTTGGGMYLSGGTVAITNSTISGNTALSDSGGIRVNGITMTVTNSTITGNTAINGTGGIDNNGALNLTDSLVVNNTGGNLGGAAPSVNSHSLTGGFAFADASTNTPGNHGGPTATFALPFTSPAIDTGVCNPTYTDPVTNTVVTVTTDQRGIARPQGNGCDIGAFESQGISVRTTGGNGQNTPVTTAFAAPLRVTATALDPGIAIGGVPLTFAAPAAGASGTFAGGTASITVNTDGYGNATAPAFMANTVTGNYAVAVGPANGINAATNITLTNTAGAAASISTVSGGNKTAQLGSAFTAPLTVQVRDQYTNPVPASRSPLLPPPRPIVPPRPFPAPPPSRTGVASPALPPPLPVALALSASLPPSSVSPPPRVSPSLTRRTQAPCS